MAEDIGILSGLTPREDYIPNLQSVYGDIIQNAADYQYFTAPLSNQGRTTATYGGQNNIVVAPDTPVRVVNNATGEVVYSGVGYEGAQGAIDAANALSASTGKKANWDIQVAGPTMQGFQSVSTDRPDVSTLGILADVALPVAASLIVPGGGFLGTMLPAAGGSALSSVAQGRSLEDTLLRSALAAAGAGVGEVAFTPAVDAVGRGIEQLASNAIANLGSSVTGSALGSTAGSVAGAAAGAIPSGLSDIVVTALGNVPAVAGGAFGSLAGSFVPSVFDAAQLNNVLTMDQTGAEPPSDYVVTAQVPTGTTPTIPGVIPPSTTNPPPFNPTEDINVTAKDTTKTTPTTPGVIPPTTTNPPPFNPAEDIKVTAPKDTQVITPPVIAPPFAPTSPPVDPSTSPTTKDNGVLGTGLSLAQLASILGIGVDLLGKLIGGGGGEGATTPYVSPFGGGATLNLGGRTQINPNIADYERYGFGPEALFFSQGQNIPYVPPVTTATTGGTTTGGTTRTTTGQTGVISQPRMTNTTNDDVVVPGATTAPTLLPNMVSSLGPTATSAQIEGALANAKTAQEATKINPGTVYYNIDTATADALGDRGLIGDVMSIQQLQQAMAARELTDPNKFATNLFQQIGEQYNKGVLNIDQARAIQQQIQQEQARTGASTQNMQNIFNTAMQQYKPLI